ncbi:MAG: Calx-beta domain-containing protein, partial [Planctomycetota bacterium]
MFNRVTGLVCAVFFLFLVNTCVGRVRLAFDCGGCGPLQDGWIAITSCGTYTDVGGTEIDVTLAVGDGGECNCRGYFDEGSDGPATGPLAYVEQDFLFANDRRGSPDADFIITFSDLVAGAHYRLLSYHNRLDESQTTIQAVDVTGATNVVKPDTIDQEHNRIINPAAITFTAGKGDVTIRYRAPKRGRKRDQVFVNGFALEGGRADVSFESASSGGVETEGTVEIKVKLSEAQAETVTVRYTVTGGTARGEGLDYVLRPGTLTFNAGETEKAVSLHIVGDGMDEKDETVEVALSKVEGGEVVMGAIETHTYTLVDPRASIGFAPARSVRLESESPVEVTVRLARSSEKTVAAGYEVVGGSATAGVDYKESAPGRLVFSPGETSKIIELEVFADDVREGPEQ